MTKIYNMGEEWEVSIYNKKLGEENKITEEYEQKKEELEQELKNKIKEIWKI